LDFFFLFGFEVSVLSLSLFSNKTWLGVNVSTLSLMPPTLISTASAVRNEWKFGTKLAIALLLFHAASIVAQCQCALLVAGRAASTIRFYSQHHWDDFLNRTWCYAAFAMTCLFATIAVAVWCLLNFDKGLKSYLRQGSMPEGHHSGQRIGSHAARKSQEVHVLPRRMDLD
jgi:hypothetical protein